MNCINCNQTITDNMEHINKEVVEKIPFQIVMKMNQTFFDAEHFTCVTTEATMITKRSNTMTETRYEITNPKMDKKLNVRFPFAHVCAEHRKDAVMSLNALINNKASHRTRVFRGDITPGCFVCKGRTCEQALNYAKECYFSVVGKPEEKVVVKEEPKKKEEKSQALFGNL